MSARRITSGVIAVVCLLLLLCLWAYFALTSPKATRQEDQPPAPVSDSTKGALAPMKLWTTWVDLPGGGRVLCVNVSGQAVSCDWEGADRG